MLRTLTVWAARSTPEPLKRWIHNRRGLDGMVRKAFATMMRASSDSVIIPSGPMAGIRLAVGEHISHAHISGVYELDTLCAIDRLVAPGAICYDLGASIGYMTLLMARKAKHVYAFEPAPHAAAEIRRQMAANGLENYTIVPDPVSDGRRQIQFALTDTAYGSRISEVPDGKWPVLELTTITLDEFAASHPFPDFMKIDVEDEEGRVLARASSILEKRKCSICCELHSENSARQVTGILDQYGYRITTVDGTPFQINGPVIPGCVQVIAVPLP
jgi:FkbM family methyltransferase